MDRGEEEAVRDGAPEWHREGEGAAHVGSGVEVDERIAVVEGRSGEEERRDGECDRGASCAPALSGAVRVRRAVAVRALSLGPDRMSRPRTEFRSSLVSRIGSSRTPLNASMLPTTSQSNPLIARFTAARITAFNPGASPPPVDTAMRWIGGGAATRGD